MIRHHPSADVPLANNRSRLLTVVLAGVLLLVAGINYYFGQQAHQVHGHGGRQRLAAEVDAELGVTLEQRHDDRPPPLVVPHRQRMTVLDAMRSAADADDAWHFTYEGTGANAFLTVLGEQGNEGGDGRNWQYEVNAMRPSVSFGAKILQPGDHVLWKFAPYE
jgi:hypothetical protein